MIRSLNFLLELSDVDTESQPPGEVFSKELYSLFASKYTIGYQLEIWRDVGWQFTFSIDEEEYLVVISFLADKRKALLQISPYRTPTFLFRLLGFQPSATQNGLSCRHLELKQLLKENPRIVSVEFAYNRFPKR